MHLLGLLRQDGHFCFLEVSFLIVRRWKHDYSRHILIVDERPGASLQVRDASTTPPYFLYFILSYFNILLVLPVAFRSFQARDQPALQASPKPQQRQHQILNLLSHKGPSPPYSFKKGTFSSQLPTSLTGWG